MAQDQISIGPADLAELLFEVLRQQPDLLPKDRMTPDMLAYEDAARSAISDWAEGRIEGFEVLPTAVRALVTAFMTQFLARLAAQDPAFVGATWTVPRQGTALERARRAIAQELQGQTPPPRSKH